MQGCSQTKGKLFWIVSYPKSGNTWMRSFIYALQNEGVNEIDINAIQTGSIASQYDWVANGLGFDIDELPAQEVDRLRPKAYRFISDNLTAFGYHKVHDAQYAVSKQEVLFPADATQGVLLIVRNPLDIAVSFAHHLGVDIDTSIVRMADKDFGLASRVKGRSIQLRQKLLSWSGHVQSWRRTDLPVCMLRYEDMLALPLATFKTAARFLRLPADTQRVSRALELCRFEGFQNQEQNCGFIEKSPKASAFFRKGIVGDWRNVLSASQVDRIIEAHGEVMATLGYLDGDGKLTQLCG